MTPTDPHTAAKRIPKPVPHPRMSVRDLSGGIKSWNRVTPKALTKKAESPEGLVYGIA
jgi:hypothetical protein